MKQLFLFFFAFLSPPLFGQENPLLINTERGSLFSNALDEERSYQIYLPESYHYSKKGNYPVVYMVDGDYNFYYQTGIVE